MVVIGMFKCSDSLDDMQQSLKDDGLIGVSGGRVSVRKVLSELISSINRGEESEDRYMSLTCNHPDTELGYAWDTSSFTPNEAKSCVLKAYGKKN